MRGAVCLLIALLTLSCRAAPPRAPSPPPLAATPLFWRVVDANGDAALYLLGTLHFARDAGWRLAPSVRDAFSEARRLIVEADAATISRDGMRRIAARHSLLPEESPLASQISPALHDRLRQHLRARGVDPSSYEKLKPWMAAVSVGELDYEQLGFDRSRGVERSLLVEARGDKEIMSLESVEGQYAMMDGLPTALQELLLEDTLRRSEDRERLASGLVDAWQRGDEDRLVEFVTEAMDETPGLADFYETVIFARNDTMTEALLAQIEQSDGPGFAALGVAHLVGPRGIAAQLAGRGYRVERLSPPAPNPE